MILGSSHRLHRIMIWKYSTDMHEHVCMRWRFGECAEEAWNSYNGQTRISATEVPISDLYIFIYRRDASYDIMIVYAVLWDCYEVVRRI